MVVFDDKRQLKLITYEVIQSSVDSFPVSSVKVICFFFVMVCIFSLIWGGFLRSLNKAYRRLFPSEQLGVAVTLQICMWEVHRLLPSKDRSYHMVFRGYLSP